MSQPFKRGAKVPAPGTVDKSIGEFWVANAWDIDGSGHNLSAFERKRMFLNVGGHDFLDVSYLSGADNDGDGRSVVAADFRNDGRLDLVERNLGGGPLFLYENQFPRRHYLEVSLRGTRSNSLGIGARVTAKVQGRQIVRELYPQNTYRSEGPPMVNLGLAEAQKVDQLVIRWPSGTVQELHDLAADRRVLITEGTEGAAAVKTIVPGRTY